ncbi:uncharacterized protein LOC119339690 [Triticum dicoccoides]|uniref:uncharacterized protein LOC119339690 n=1 Tax=Triticum dicoccoides TaxID=85692 RepID=UPI0018910A8F|nr:uncharacterized protein LOC119339690 [Triticum dicoccoides]
MSRVDKELWTEVVLKNDLESLMTQLNSIPDRVQAWKKLAARCGADVALSLVRIHCFGSANDMMSFILILWELLPKQAGATIAATVAANSRWAVLGSDHEDFCRWIITLALREGIRVTSRQIEQTIKRFVELNRHDLEGLVSNDIYYVWNHGPKFGGGFDCRYCPLITRGGGATRFREHLGGIPGDVRECPNVPRNIHAAMRESRDDSMRKKREKKNRRFRLERDIMEGLYHGEGVINIEDDEEEIQAALRETLRDKNVSRAVERRRGSGSGVCVSLGKQSITSYFDKELSSNKVSMQPKINTALNVESKDVLGQAWAKFFHANDIAGLKANFSYFRAAVKITQNLGPAPVPTAKEIDGIYLDKNYEEAEQWLKMFKQDWRNYGVTVMCDSWTWPTGMSLINSMVYCNAWMFFHKSIDASGQTQTSTLTGNVVGGLAQGWHVHLQRKCHQLSGGSNLEGKFLICRSVP